MAIAFAWKKYNTEHYTKSKILILWHEQFFSVSTIKEIYGE